ncbi:hypothetical protein FA15DRAFT_667840 [Coprinopsis marcescibilis]|uniref:NADH dehydrogenase [ubiquinone] 1 alpha subcomplex subunit n=1 Tax=Coprinopsis marcescibilis TaxID=230819 RepID=A0A5C3L0L9_COPMA|nr:hypothetical protein FA15DRAFT_667840 [Coprinopsis marcescibilis]
MSFLARIWTAMRSSKRYVGRDLEGNKFYENPISHNDRPKRTIVYREPEDMWDYIGGKKKIPIQWSAWMSHTRPNPPTLEELQSDLQRQMRVRYNASLIEAKDREESEQLRRLQEETHAELLRAPRHSQLTSEPETTRSTPTSGHTPGGGGHSDKDATPNPWAAADAPVETETWTPQLRKRGP